MTETVKYQVGQKVYLRDVNERLGPDGVPPLVKIAKVGRTLVHVEYHGRTKAFDISDGREAGAYDHASVQTIEEYAEEKARKATMGRIRSAGLGSRRLTTAQLNAIADICEEPVQQATPPSVIDAAHIARQRDWSAQTFGPRPRTFGITDHIRKELAEIEDDPTDVTEWADVVILALDGAWRAGHEPQAIIDAIVAKQAVNEARVWPDWREVGEDAAIEHIEPGHVHQCSAAMYPAHEPTSFCVCNTCGQRFDGRGFAAPPDSADNVKVQADEILARIRRGPER